MTSLSAKEFPRSPKQTPIMHFSIKQRNLRKLIEKTSFAIPQQDVRQYLNGLLFEVKNGQIKTLATDGHRLAMYSMLAPTINHALAQVIIPRKGISDLLRSLYDDTDEEVTISFDSNLIRIDAKNFVLISKLISGRFPNYNKIIPKKGKKKIEITRNDLKAALSRVGILSNELFRSVCFKLRKNALILDTNNPEQEEAIEELPINYQEEDLDIIFNINYFIDILNILETEKINIFLESEDSGIVIEEDNEPNSLYILMPIRR